MDEPHFAELYCGNTGSGKSSTIAMLSNKFRMDGWSAIYCTSECKGTTLIDPFALEHFLNGFTYSALSTSVYIVSHSIHY